MRQFSKKLVSIFLSVVLVLGIFSVILPTAKLIQNAKAENAAEKIDYTKLLQNFKNDVSVNDTRVWNYEREGEGVIYDFGTKGLSEFGIWNAMGLDVAYGALGISHHFFSGTAVGAEDSEISPYIVYNVTPGTSFSLSTAAHNEKGHGSQGCEYGEASFKFYVSNDSVTWIPVDAEKNLEGVWNSTVWADDDDHRTYGSYDSYVYTIANVGLKTNFVKVEYPITKSSPNTVEGTPTSCLMVHGVDFTPVAEYAVNDQTLFEAKSFGAQKAFYEEHFIAYPDFVNNGTENAATSDFVMLKNSTWGDFGLKESSYIAMVAPGSHFYLETANNWYMKTLGEALVAKNKLESAAKARIRVYSSATLTDDLSAWQEWDPMPYVMNSNNHTPTFNFYLPEDHIYVRIVYPQKGKVGTAPGFADTSCVGNDAAFFNDMVFTPYEASEATFTRNYEGGDSVWEGFAQLDGSWVSPVANRGITIPFYGGNNTINNFANDNELNTDARFENGKFSIAYYAQGGQMFTLNYASRNTDWNPSNSKKCYEANVIDGSKLEFIIESSKDGTIWENAYQTESGYAEKASTFSDDTSIRLFDVSYLVPEGAKYVRVSFGITGVGYVDAANNRLNFNDCLYLRGVSLADANNVYTAPAQDSSSGPVEYIYTTDTDGSKVKEKGPNTPAGEIDGAVGFSGDWTYLAGGDGDNPKTLAGILERPYVIYNVIPGSTFSFDYAMRATAKAASETTAALNIKGGLGDESRRDFEFFVYGRADESSEWTPIGTTNSNTLDYRGGDSTSYNTFGYNNSSFPVPANVNQIKVELPQTGGFTTATPVTHDYSTLDNVDYWNVPEKKALLGDGLDTICDYMITKESSNPGLAPGFGLLDCEWGAKEFYLIYKVEKGTTFVANFLMADEGTKDYFEQYTNEPFEAKVQYSADKSTWSEAITTEGQGTNAVLACTVPSDSDYYVKITFPQKGKMPTIGDRGNNAATLTGVSFYTDGAWVTAGNDAAYLYNVEYATGIKVDPNNYIYTTDTNASKGRYDGNLIEAGGSFDVGNGNTTSVRPGYGYLIGGDGNNPKMLAGTQERPYVIYDVIPGSEFSFDFKMDSTAAALSEAAAALNIKGGLGNAGLKEFDFFVYGRADENSEWTYIGQTNSFDGTYTVNVPVNINQIKVAFPQTGGYGDVSTYDYATEGKGDCWNASAVGADFVNFVKDVTVIGNEEGERGLHPTYGCLTNEWDTNKEFYLIYKVKAGTTFVANFYMVPDIYKRAEYKEINGEPFEFTVSSCATREGEYSSALTTEGMNTNTPVIVYKVPAGCEYVKVTFPQKGKFYHWGDLNPHDIAFLTGVTFYRSDVNITAGNEAAYLYNVKYATGKKPGPDVDYTALDDANISSSNKAELNIYNFFNISIVKDEGIVANSNEAFVTYKIKEDTMLTLNTTFDLSFEYSVDDSDYKPFTAVKTCYGYVIPAIAGRNYIKVNLKNGQSITKADAEILGPTARFYIPYLNKYELKDYADYGADYGSPANSVPSADLIRPGYKFIEWDGYNSDSVYIDKTFEATFNKITNEEKYTYTIEYTAGDKTTTKQDLHFDDAVTITAPATNDAGQEFSKWVDDKGVTVSYKQSFTILANGDLSLRAVYASDKANIGAHIYATDEPIIKKNDNGTWNMSVVWRIEITEDVKLVETGILYGKDVEQANLILLDGEAQKGTAKVKHSNTDANRTAMYTVKNIKADQTRTALPYAILSNGDVIYGERAIKVRGGDDLVESSTFAFKERISTEVLNKYLDRTVTYDAFGTINSQTHAEAVADARDFVRRTGAKYLARATGAWIPNKTDIYGDNFTNYTKWASEIHEADPDVILEACIFETVTSATDGLAIPKWVQEAFGLTYDSSLTFDHTEMMHDLTYYDYSNLIPTKKTYGENRWGDGIHIPSISKVQTKMYIYYRACTYIDMGFEAIHLGQMYRIGADSVSSAEKVNSVDLVNWELVLGKITEYAKTHARRGYVLFNGHTENYAFENADGSQMLDFNMSPVRIQADASTGTKQTATSTDLQPVRLSKSTDGENVPYLTVTEDVTTRSGEKCNYFPYLLEFDNFGYDKDYIDKANNKSQYDFVWGYDEISWYANQDPALRAAYLSTLNDSIKGLASAPNGHIAMPGRRTAFISNTGCSEYKDLDWVKALMNDDGIASISLWEVSETDIAAIIDAWN